MELKKGDVCSLEVVVSHQPTPDEVIVIVPLSAAPAQSRCVPADKLTLLRRAPVDLATCDLPVRVMWTHDQNETLMVARYEDMAWLSMPIGTNCFAKLADLRPADAPAPAAEAGEVERQMLAQLLDTIGAKHLTEAETFVTRMRGEVERLRAKCDMLSAHVRSLEARLAQDAPTCPPGHIMIGDRAVPEPMLEAPEIGAEYWYPTPCFPIITMMSIWNNYADDQIRLRNGLIHSTESAALIHAEAIVALSAKREG